MARLNADDMIAIVRDCCGGETTGTLSNTRILRFLNEAALNLVSKYTFDQLSTSTTITTVSGTASYELSVGDLVEFTDLVNDTQNFKLYPMSEEQYHSYTQGDAQSGSPNYWFVDGVGSNDLYQLTLWPTPNSADSVIVYYIKLEELVTSPAATSLVIPRVWDKVVYLYAASAAWEMLGDYERSEVFNKMAARNEAQAARTVKVPSWIPQNLGSPVGTALRNGR